MSDDEKKSIDKLSVKLALQIEEKQNMAKKVVGLETIRKELSVDLEKVKDENKTQIEELKKLKNENSALFNKLDYKSYLLKECDKEKD